MSADPAFPGTCAGEFHDVVVCSSFSRPDTHLAHTPRACPLEYGAPLRPAHTPRAAPSALPGPCGVPPFFIVLQRQSHRHAGHAPRAMGTRQQLPG